MHLYRYCIERGITFTRSRPYRKNYSCYVERRPGLSAPAVGYSPYDTPEELEGLRELYPVLRFSVNFFQPQMNLVSQTRHGAKVIKRFDLARTPYQRALDSPHVGEAAKGSLRQTYLTLNPVQLKRDLATCQTRLLQLTANKTLRKEVGYPPGHPFK